MRRSAIILIIAALIVPQLYARQVSAQAFVVGCATGGPLATPMGVAAAATSAAQSVSSTMRNTGKSIKMEQKKIVAAINKNFETQNSLIRQIVASLGVSMEKMENMRMFGPQSKAYGIGTVDGRLNTVMTGKTAEARLARNFGQSITEYAGSFKNRQKRTVYYQQKEVAAISPEFFFPQNATLSADQLNKAMFAIRVAVDPFPTPPLREGYSEQKGAQKYEAHRKIKYSRLAMPSAVISGIVASYAPVMELGEWAEKTYADMGGQGKPAQVVNGKISPMGYIDMMVSSRFANQEWYSGEKGIHAKTPTGLLRELAIMESVNMEMQRRQMAYMQQTAGLLAQDQALEAGRQHNTSLNAIYTQTAQ